MLVLTVALSFFITDVFAQDAPKAKNVIILIGDGMGFNSDIAGTYYRYGEAGKQSYHSFPVQLACTTYAQAKAGKPIPADCKGYDPEVFWASLTGGTQGTEFTTVTDSAASSTAIHGGIKTLNGKIGVDDQNNPVELVSEIAFKTGRKVGSVTTVPIGHATPAGFCTHSVSRGDMDEIFLQMSDANSPLTVVMGTGHPLYASGRKRSENANETEAARKSRFQAVGGEATWEKMESGTLNGFTVIDTKEQFAALASGTVLPEKVIGIVRSQGSVPPIDGILDDVEATQKMFESAYPRTEVNELPDLTTMSLGAINLLTRDNDRGFILMIEGGAIDGGNHGRNINQCILEHTGFTKAIDAVIQWVETKSSWDETLVIITADHETGQLWGPDTYQDVNGNGVYDKGDIFNSFTPLVNAGRGNAPKVQYGSGGHTNALVPLFAKGPGSNLFLNHVRGTDVKAAEYWKFSGKYVDDTDIFRVIQTVLAP